MNDYGQFCALARAAEILGERWTLLIIRELYLGPKRYSDLMERLHPIAPGVLNGRLRRLEHRGLIVRRQVPAPTPARLWELSEEGRALEPVLLELLRWGARFLFPERPGDRFEPEWLAMVLTAYSPSPRNPVAVGMRVDLADGSKDVVVEGGTAGWRVAPPGRVAEATIAGPVAAILGVISGQRSMQSAVDGGQIRVTGDLTAAAAIIRSAT